MGFEFTPAIGELQIGGTNPWDERPSPGSCRMDGRGREACRQFFELRASLGSAARHSLEDQGSLKMKKELHANDPTSPDAERAAISGCFAKVLSL